MATKSKTGVETPKNFFFEPKFWLLTFFGCQMPCQNLSEIGDLQFTYVKKLHGIDHLTIFFVSVNQLYTFTSLLFLTINFHNVPIYKLHISHTFKSGDIFKGHFSFGCTEFFRCFSRTWVFFFTSFNQINFFFKS